MHALRRGARALAVAVWITATAAAGTALCTPSALAAPLTREQALAAAERQDRAVHLTGIGRLAEIGRMADVERLLPLLGAPERERRDAVQAAILQIWSRSGDAAIDKLYARGVAQMQASDLDAALATFSDIVKRRPAFAEGWNKRATVYFLRGQYELSLADCEQVFKRNPRHFGALSGAGQIHLKQGQLKLALKYFRLVAAINPNLEGTVETVHELERQIDGDSRTGA